MECVAGGGGGAAALDELPNRPSVRLLPMLEVRAGGSALFAVGVVEEDELAVESETTSCSFLVRLSEEMAVVDGELNVRAFGG